MGKKIIVHYGNIAGGISDFTVEETAKKEIEIFRQGASIHTVFTSNYLLVLTFKMLVAEGYLSPKEVVFTSDWMQGEFVGINEKGEFTNDLIEPHIDLNIVHRRIATQFSKY